MWNQCDKTAGGETVKKIGIRPGVLNALQEKYSLSDTGLARKIGIDVSMLWRIKHGRSRPGAGFIARTLAVFPEINFEDAFCIEDLHGSDAKREGSERE